MLSLLLTLHAKSFPLLFAFFASGELSHADPVVPILIASIFITLGAALGGLLMKWLKQPAVLGELLVGLLAGNLGYYFGNPAITVLREGDNLSRIAALRDGSPDPSGFGKPSGIRKLCHCGFTGEASG